MIKVVVGNNVKRESVIVDNNTTLRKVLEDAGIDYTRGVMHLDGSSLQPGDLDKSFAAFGITDKCFLLNVVKADNAAKVTIAGDAVVITSALTLEEIKTVGKYRPKALTLMGGENNKEPIFVLGTSSNGSINKYGASFAGVARDGSGKATITLMMKGSTDNIKEAVADNYGAALVSLNKLEQALPAVLEEIKVEREGIMAAISVQ